LKIQYIVAISSLLLQHIGITLAKWETIL